MAVLYRNCPKCAAESGGADACPACGLIFAKYFKARVAVPAPAAREEREESESLLARAKELAFHVPEEVEPIALYGRSLLLAAAAVYGARLVMMDIPDWEMSRTFMHLVLLPFHEFGHLLFRPFGEFLMLLGGSLFQVLLPLLLGGYFLVKNRDPYAAALMLWWAAGGILDTAPYIYDAWKPQHVLLTGRTGDTGAHDFIDVLGDLGLLQQAQPIGRAVHAFGTAVMLLALAWGAWLLAQQYRARRG
jgi:hypothetical protein